MMNRFHVRQFLGISCCALAALMTATTSPAQTQANDEIIVCGERFHTGTPIVLWTDAGGYDFHYTTAPVGTPEERKPHSVRQSPLTDEQIAQVRRTGRTPELLRQNVDQFVIHYSVDPTSRDTFNTLVKRHLSSSSCSTSTARSIKRWTRRNKHPMLRKPMDVPSALKLRTSAAAMPPNLVN